MQKIEGRTRGFTLIASLLLLLLMSGIAIGLLSLVNTEGQVGSHDLENNLAYHSAEGAMEKMSSDINTKYQSMLSPGVTDLENASAVPTNDPNVTYPDYSITPHTNTDGSLQTGWGKITSGPYTNLYAQILQMDLKATAKRTMGLGDEVTMARTIEVAMIPVFQFGVFSDSDLGFFSSPTLDFAGRVHTNGNLFLGVANCCTITFHDKITAYGEVVRQQLPNGLAASSNNDSGTVDILTASAGCDGSQPNCRSMAATEGSVVAGPTSAYNAGSTGKSPTPSWYTISTSDYNGWITNGDWGGPNGTGVSKLSLPFVGGGAQPYEIIRRPIANESAASPTGASRLYNEAQIRVLLSDDPADLPGGAGDPGNIRLANVQTSASAPNFSNGVQAGVPSSMATLSSGGKYMTYFAEGSTGIPNPTGWSTSSPTLSSDWTITPATAPSGYNYLNPATAPVTGTYSGSGSLTTSFATQTTGSSATALPYPYYTPTAPNANTWNLLDGYLRVEVRSSTGSYTAVTQEWLQLGFARGLAIPSGAGTNPINPYAILVLQVPADRNGDGSLDATGTAPTCSGSGSSKKCTGKPPELLKDTTNPTNSVYYGNSLNTTSVTRNNWYPINFYDAREGEVRDVVQNGDESCAVAGMMNAIDLDVANLRYWLANSTTGKAVDYNSQNGYILYFSDRRGMIKNPNGTPTDYADTTNTKTGDSGLEDSINSSASTGTPDGALDPIPSGQTYSPEDVNLNGKLDNWGAMNLGLGFGLNSTITTSSTKPNPYVRIPDPNCPVTGRKNWVSGARHVLKLIDGAIVSGAGLPTQPGGTGGFTVASENPVYIQGNYNTTGSSDTTWSGGSDVTGHAAAAVIADAVTLLSGNWTEMTSLTNPSNADTGPRPATTTYYRLAIAAGKNVNFPSPSWATSTIFGFGTDGGLHNFLRFLEDWSSATLNYKGSLVSLYYSTYATGTFKCCAYSVYQPPNRNYTFDSDFASYSGLPPGTPMFRDVENLTYHQVFSARTQ